MRVKLRAAAKSIARGLATVTVAPALLSFSIRSKVIGRDRALEGSTQALGLVPGVVGQYLRRGFLSRVLAECHPSATVEFGTIFSKVGARLCENSYVGPRCHLGLVHLERDAMLAAGVHIPSGGHTHGIADLSVPMRDQPGTRTLVRVGAGSWVGSGAIILSDVGCNTVVGAGAVVTRSLPDSVIAGGVPARVLRNRGEYRERA